MGILLIQLALKQRSSLTSLQASPAFTQTNCTACQALCCYHTPITRCLAWTPSGVCSSQRVPVHHWRAETATCTCGRAVENVAHFLLSCLLYESLRHSMITSIRRIVGPTVSINSQTLLGNPHKLSQSKLLEVVTVVAKYIADTKRFHQKKPT